MSIADGEYDIDLGILEKSIGDAFGIRYGVVPSDVDQAKPIKLYDDSKNLIVEVKDKDDRLIVFEGVSQVNNSKNPVMANYYFTFENNMAKLGKLNKTIRVNKSRNSIKWNNLIRKWNNELESQNIISESDFENLDEFPDFQLEFDDNDIDLGIDKEESGGNEESNAKNKLEAEKLEQKRLEQKRLEKETLEKQRIEKQRLEKERVEKERLEKERIKQQILEKDKKAREQEERSRKQKQQKLQQEKERAKLEVQRKQAEAYKQAQMKQTMQASATSNPRRGGAGKSLSSKRVSGKMPPKRPHKNPTVEDDFQDLEDQLQEVLGDNENSDSESEYDDVFTGGPITIIENKSSKTNNTTSRINSQLSRGPGKRPMSLRSLMGERENEDGSSSEEE